MPFVSASVNVTPPCFYRSPETIKDDIRKISARISEVNGMLNIRELLSGYLDGDIRFDGESARDLSELLEFARETLDELTELNSSLDELKRELIEAVSVIG